MIQGERDGLITYSKDFIDDKDAPHILGDRLDLVPTVPFDDVIDRKGRGLNVLLHGPGVGKTFTVEATAERFNVPLYSISIDVYACYELAGFLIQIPAGELVVDHDDSNALEQQLETIFQIAKHFNIILLLGEADAFMEQRASYHDTHNRLVTIFLRKLEYYRGILFLTTNRMIQFDEAIISRIHLTIKYEGLTREFRREIWRTQLSRARIIRGCAVIRDDELEQLENLSLNGRETNTEFDFILQLVLPSAL
ncbi:ATPase AAA-type core [Penicillium cf. viridicatum]|uniref:ATPase AAA-type core n=1 Tax=Penicillium cf. viridicatum TaxID=2972119 RepID=A0A9W9SWH3_9EURO|nr:ATPase AAA-type core [Penicillium cf. viridicatum]